MPSATTPPAGLTPSQLSTWHDNGYLIIPDALDAQTVSALLKETHRMLDEDLDVKNHPMTRFSTGEGNAEHVGDDYFLTSGDKIRFFFEEDAFDPTTSELTKPAPLAINKIGHALHTLSPQFRAASLSATNAAIGRSLGFQDPRILQSMIICKQPEIGGRVPPHQDSTFLYTDPPSAVGFWYALEDATVENGCLSFLKGSHKTAPIRSRFVRNGKGGTGFEDNTSAQFPASTKTSTDASDVPGTNGYTNGTAEKKREDAQSNEDEYTLGPVKAGSLVLIHGNLLHKSERNASQKSRFIYTYHMIEGGEETGHVYDEKNWLQPTEEGFSRLYAEAR